MEFSLEQLAHDLQGLSPEEHGFTYLDLSRTTASTSSPVSHTSDNLPLQGWLLSAKDLNDVAGMPTSLGARHRAYLADRTDAFIASLEARGAAIIGKSATPELGLRVDCEPTDMPHPDNPLYPGHTPGGSSGGAAVHVARGLLRAAHATDGGGSIRVPAAACGVVGFKPAGHDLTVHGFITRNVTDTALLHDLRLAPPPRLRIGVLTEPLFAQVEVQPEFLAAIARTAGLLENAGFPVIPLQPYPLADATFEAFTHLFTSRLAALPEDSSPASDGYFNWARATGLAVSAGQRHAAQRHAEGLARLLTDFWRVDVLLTPTLTSPPPRRGAFQGLPPADNFAAQTRWSPWGSLFNVARLPAISLPMPSHPHPISIHLGGITVNDAELLSLARLLEKEI
ncbi:MAG: amidase [Corynebacterium sp.]|nr:amidase [Corynebacterium sp.]